MQPVGVRLLVKLFFGGNASDPSEITLVEHVLNDVCADRLLLLPFFLVGVHHVTHDAPLPLVLRLDVLVVELLPPGVLLELDR